MYGVNLNETRTIRRNMYKSIGEKQILPDLIFQVLTEECS